MSDQAKSPTAEQPWPNQTYAWYVVIVLYFGAVISFLDRQIIALVVADIKADLGLTDFEIGLLQGPPFGIFYALMSVPIALMADQRSRRNIIIAGVTFWSMATAACGMASQFVHLFLARIGVGVGEATLGPSAYSIISDYFPKRKLAMAMSVFTMGNLTGVGLAMVLGGALIAALKDAGTLHLPLLGDLKPWQAAFVAAALPGLILAMLMLTVREPLRRGRTSEVVDSKQQMAEFVAFVRSHKGTLTTLFISYSMLVLVAYGNFSWMVVFFSRSFGWTASEAGYVYGMVVLVFGTSGAFFGGWYASWLDRRGYRDAPFRATLICAIPTAPVAAGVFLFAPDAWWAVACLALWQFLAAVPAGLSGAAMMSITPNQMRAKISSFYLFVSNIVGISLGATSVGFLTTYVFKDDQLLPWSLAVVNCGLPPVVCVLMYLGLRMYRKSLADTEAATAA
ncbi:MFS transporter [Emcibacter sp. SYSU 3D8]|uniref:MFS transporter n=1 Tax=Emcibacter sp. SYSU 3D8 TaxID=3133969 RepID=UPI0031FF24CB